jgi:N,N'-diacetyllegionaminate synthase
MKKNWKKTIKVGRYLIGDGKPVFVIAEAGVNHNGKISLAKKIIDAALDANANAVKFQTYITSKLVSKKLAPQMYKMLQKYELQIEDFAELRDYSKSNKIIFSSTPFDITSCNLLERLDVPFYKIGSGDLENIPLIVHASKKGKPILLSTGMSTNKEIKEALHSILPYNNNVVLMHCTSLYPTYFDEANLNIIPVMKTKFNVPIGYSDHTLGYAASLAAVSLRACVIEKHLTLDNKMQGPDHKASLDPKTFKEMVTSIRNIEESFGTSVKQVLPREKNIRKIARRSIVAICDIPKGKVIDRFDIDILRPYGGIAPKYFNKIIGKKSRMSIKNGSFISWSMLQ